MNILFLFIGSFNNINQHEIYPDLVRKFQKEGHDVYVVCSNERRYGKSTELVEQNSVKILRVKIGNITRCNFVEKGISTVLIEHQYKRAIQKFFSDVTFNAVVYSTPPITLSSTVMYIKKRDSAISYLMLKDIFPQNAVDIKILSTKGIKGIIYRFFKTKEARLYKVSDYIGCMSEANRKYLLENNGLDEKKLGICPNCFEIRRPEISDLEKNRIRDKYNIPQDRMVLLYGGNLGRPQGIPFLLECLKAQKENRKVYFLIVGGGTEYNTIEKAINEENFENVKLISHVPTADYEKMVCLAHAGLIFLDYRFTIPNYPSRILPYMQAGIPLIACTDPVTDIRELIEENDIGWWCPSNDCYAFSSIIEKLDFQTLENKGMKGFKILKEKFDISVAYNSIITGIENVRK